MAENKPRDNNETGRQSHQWMMGRKTVTLKKRKTTLAANHKRMSVQSLKTLTPNPHPSNNNDPAPAPGRQPQQPTTMSDISSCETDTNDNPPPAELPDTGTELLRFDVQPSGQQRVFLQHTR